MVILSVHHLLDLLSLDVFISVVSLFNRQIPLGIPITSSTSMLTSQGDLLIGTIQ